MTAGNGAVVGFPWVLGVDTALVGNGHMGAPVPFFLPSFPLWDAQCKQEPAADVPGAFSRSRWGRRPHARAGCTLCSPPGQPPVGTVRPARDRGDPRGDLLGDPLGDLGQIWGRPALLILPAVRFSTKRPSRGDRDKGKGF